MDKAIINNYIEENRDRFLEELFGLLRIPSVSADKQYKDDVRKAASYVMDRLKEAGADHAEICETDGHPIVFGEKIHN